MAGDLVVLFDIVKNAARAETTLPAEGIDRDRGGGERLLLFLQCKIPC